MQAAFRRLILFTALIVSLTALALVIAFMEATQMRLERLESPPAAVNHDHEIRA